MTRDETPPQDACPVDVWDGPYKMRCGRVLVNGEYGRHGKLTRDETPRDPLPLDDPRIEPLRRRIHDALGHNWEPPCGSCFDRAYAYLVTGDALASSTQDALDVEARRLLGYLWTATGKNYLRPVSDLFAEDDPIVADIERVAIFPEDDAARGQQ